MNQSFPKTWIFTIFVVLIACGFFAWQYFGAPKEEVKTPEEITDEKKEEIIIDEQKLAEEVVIKYLNTIMLNNTEEALSYISRDSKGNYLLCPTCRYLNLRLKKFEILRKGDLSGLLKTPFTVREYLGSFEEKDKITGYVDEELRIEKEGDRYFIASISYTEFIDTTEENPKWKSVKTVDGYEIKYPKDFHIMSVWGERLAISNAELPMIGAGAVDWMGRDIIFFGAKNGMFIEINTYPSAEKDFSIYSKSSFTIDNNPASISREEVYNGCLAASLGVCGAKDYPKGDWIDYQILTLKNDKVYEIKAQIKMEEKEYDKIFNQMLSTFRFLE